MPTKIDDAVKKKAVADFVSKRKTARQIAEELGVTQTAVRVWAREATAKVLEPEVLGPVPKPDLDAGGGLDAARKAANLPPREKPSVLDDAGGAKVGPDGKPEVVPIDPEAAVGLAEMALFLTTRGYCAANGIEPTDEVQKLCKLSDEERRHLRSVAPYAGKYLAVILSKFDLIGFALFVGGFVMILATRISKLKPMAKPRPKPAPKKKPDDAEDKPDDGVSETDAITRMLRKEKEEAGR